MRLRMNDYTIKTRAVYFAKGKGKRLMSVIRKGKNKAKKKISGMVKRAYYFTFGLAGKLLLKRKPSFLKALPVSSTAAIREQFTNI